MKEKTLRLGIVGLDGHGPVFAAAINGPEPKVEGMRVVTAMPVPSVMIPEERLEQNVARTRDLGIEIVDDPAALAEGVDGILIQHDDGSRHAELVKAFVDKGKPLFVDKPIEAGAAAAREIVERCREAGLPMFSASSLRFTIELQESLGDSEAGAVGAAMCYSPFKPKPSMPGWVYYGIHAVEPLFQIMGAGCREVRCVPGEYVHVATGVWSDGRLGVACGATVNVKAGYGFTIWRENAIQSRTIESGRLYPQLLNQIKDFFQTGEAPVPPDESVEVIAFLEAANASMAQDGKPVPLAE